MSFFRISDLESWIPSPYRISESFEFFVSWLTYVGHMLVRYEFKNKIIFNFVKFVASKKARQRTFYFSSSFWMEKNQYPGLTSRIRNTVQVPVPFERNQSENQSFGAKIVL